MREEETNKNGRLLLHKKAEVHYRSTCLSAAVAATAAFAATP